MAHSLLGLGGYVQPLAIFHFDLSAHTSLKDLCRCEIEITRLGMIHLLL